MELLSSRALRAPETGAVTLYWFSLSIQQQIPTAQLQQKTAQAQCQAPSKRAITTRVFSSTKHFPHRHSEKNTVKAKQKRGKPGSMTPTKTAQAQRHIEQTIDCASSTKALSLPPLKQ
jgi:hypothetical protein